MKSIIEGIDTIEAILLFAVVVIVIYSLYKVGGDIINWIRNIGK